MAATADEFAAADATGPALLSAGDVPKTTGRSLAPAGSRGQVLAQAECYVALDGRKISTESELVSRDVNRGEGRGAPRTARAAIGRGGTRRESPRARRWRRSSLVARRSSLVARRSSLVARRSSLVARRSSLVARRSSLVARRSSLVARRSTLVARRSSLVARRSSLVARRSSLCLFFGLRRTGHGGSLPRSLSLSHHEPNPTTHNPQDRPTAASSSSSAARDTPASSFSCTPLRTPDPTTMPSFWIWTRTPPCG